MKKPKYHIRNWSEYNSTLKQRGSLTIWVSPEAVEKWMMDELTGQLGFSPTYTDLAIETMATVQAIYGLAGPPIDL
jgi:DDE family transposase